jgi:hypothetical protein
MQPSLDSRPTPAPGVVGQFVEHEVVLVLYEQGIAQVLNEVGTCIWRMADGQHSVREIAAAICASYEVDIAQAETDTLAFVEELLNRNILLLAE